MQRRETKKIKVGSIAIGGDSPITVQSMVKADAHDVDLVVKQILDLEQAGCDIVRMGFLDMQSVQNISAIKKRINIPLVADIHFNHEFALEAIKQGVDKLRINPGNIGTKEQLAKVVKAAKARSTTVPIRIGVNAGSLQKDILEKYGGHPTAEGMVESARQNIQLLEDLDFDQIVVSLKASDVQLMNEAYTLFSNEYDYPLHVGVTEAGTKLSSTVKSSMGIGSLLMNGIGDTIRVSMTDSNVEEIRVGKEILKNLGLRKNEPILISCPTCSRTSWDMIPLAHKVEEYLQTIKKPIKVAVMGCVVNGPGEAREADLGIAGGNGMGVLFSKGQVIKSVPEAEMFNELKKLIDTY
ncbi:MAG: flavodoxin-dependent (E)-4-hydroxy-3-methylbut-2-enyl-diphosphate synthase [Pseudomonadales bacterium]|jgi:(E)-4-hydroxy-3-methylbut-2-enyl-diphosphate synthase|nr:flavodoxin-dependent (E)-4-hydroxy-3-methylbut-2-enyl-diphosphate synthase [Pseudomonadales bacterium]